MEGGVPEGLHLARPVNPKGVESQVDSTKVAGHPLPRKGGNPTSSGNPSLGRFHVIWKVLVWGLIRRLVDQLLGVPPI